eukprot:10529408-Lingulodinium_polyedra.AAC.1
MASRVEETDARVPSSEKATRGSAVQVTNGYQGKRVDQQLNHKLEKLEDVEVQGERLREVQDGAGWR